MTTPWLSLHLPSDTFPEAPPEHLFDRIVDQVRAAEAAGFRQVTVMGHLNQIPGVGPQTDPMLESWTVLAAAAAEASAAWVHLPPDRRASAAPATPAQAADALRPCLDAGFTGFTFNNDVYRTPERIAMLGEPLSLIGGLA